LSIHPFSKAFYVALPALLAATYLSCIAPVSYAESDALAPADDSTGSTEENTPTPLSEFAPTESNSAPGQRYDQGLTINRVSIEGNKLIQSDKIKDAMTIRPGSLYSKSTLKDDLKRIYDMGYFTEKIRAVPVSTSKGVILRIVVQENAPVSGVHIDGNTLISDKELQSIFASQTGMPQNIGQLNESIEKVEKLYADKGYVLARVANIEDDPDGVINLKINEGLIDKLQFVGNRKTKDFVIKRLLTTKEGEVYNEKNLADDLKRLYSTQAFKDVRRVITASPSNPDKYNLTIEVDEKRTGSISLGGGVDTATGLFGSVGYNDPNFLGRGQNFNSVFAVGSGIIAPNSSTQATTRNYQFDVGWSDPSFRNSGNSLSTNAFGRNYASFNVPLGVERRIGSEVSYGMPLKNVKNTSMGLSLRGENVHMRDYASASDLAKYKINDSERKRELKGGTYLSVSPTIAYDSRDNRFNPSSGWLNTISLTGAYGIGNPGYGLASANLRKYIKLREGLILALNAQGGKSVLGDVPDFNMYRMGGAYSVRGFQEGGMGIGSGYLLSTAELRAKVPLYGKMKKIPVLNTLGFASFVDAGSVLGGSNMNSIFDRPTSALSAGVGLRLNIPAIGPMRIDFAYPLLGGGGNGTYNYRRIWSFGIGEKF